MSDATFEKTLTLGDAIRISGPMAFNIMIKPAGSLCNLDCKYCYYLDKAEIYGGKEPRMTEAMLEKVVQEYISANGVPEVTFNWHGGEPLVLGLDFYRKALEFEKKYAGEKVIHNTIQTNGTLLNREWARFFHDNNFLVGISLDGPKDIHDKYRKDKGGFPTFDRVMNGLNILKCEGVEFNTMSTVNNASEGRGLETYLFLREVGSGFMQFMPVVEHVKYPLNGAGKPDKKKRPFIVDPKTDGAVIAPWSVTDVGYGRFLCDIFDYWVRNDVSRIFVTNFDATLATWVGETPGTCTFAQTCGGNAVIEHNSDLYPCDHFVYKDYLLGNIADKPIAEMMRSDKQTAFGIDKRNKLPTKCLRCEWLLACNGECPKHRFNTYESHLNGRGGVRIETGLNALCAGYKMFFSHVAPYMDYMKDLLSRKMSPAYVIPWARTRTTQLR